MTRNSITVSSVSVLHRASVLKEAKIRSLGAVKRERSTVLFMNFECYLVKYLDAVSILYSVCIFQKLVLWLGCSLDRRLGIVTGSTVLQLCPLHMCVCICRRECLNASGSWVSSPLEWELKAVVATQLYWQLNTGLFESVMQSTTIFPAPDNILINLTNTGAYIPG